MICCIANFCGTISQRRIALSLIVCACSLLLSIPDAIAQSGLRTEPSKQTQFYGQWNHPETGQAPGTPQSGPPPIQSDQFRSLFPAVEPKPFENHPTANMSPPPVAVQPPRSRPLQPLPQPMLRGQFRDAGAVDAAVTSFESANESVSQIATKLTQSAPNTDISSTWESQAEAMKGKASGMMNWISEKGQSAIDGVPDQSKDLLSKITGFIGGQDNPVRKVVGALSLVIGGYFGLVWFARKFKVGGDGRLPADVIEVLGVSPFGPRKNLQLVRLGSKLLLLMNGPDGTQSVGEITDPNEVEHLASLCKGRTTRASEGVLNAIRSHGRKERTTRAPIAGVVKEKSFSASELMQALESLTEHKSTHQYEA